MKKTLLSLVAGSLALTASAAEFFSVGGNWSDPSAWKGGVVPNGSAINIRGGSADLKSSIVVDVDATVDGSISQWGGGKITWDILSGKSLTLAGSSKDAGWNPDDTTTVVQGAGTFKSSASDGRLYVYGGEKGSSLTFTSNVDLRGVSFVNRSDVLAETTVIFNATGSNSLTTSTLNSAVTDRIAIADFYITGVKGTTTTVKLMGKVSLGDIHISKYTNVIIDSTNFSIAKSRYGLIDVQDSTLEFVGDKGKAYSVSGKVRLNGNATMIWTGVNSYTNLTNVDFNVRSLDYSTTDSYAENTVIVNGRTDSAGFCFVDCRDPKLDYTKEKVLKIQLGEVAEGDDYILKLAHLSAVAGTNNYYAITDSLTLNNKTQQGKIEGLFVEFINFDNGKVKLTNDLLTAEDWTHVRADGWENFRLENGYITADRIAVPEPAEWAMIFGAIALGFVAYRRRK